MKNVPGLNPDDFFSEEESERRMKEAMNRLFGRPHTMNMRTGQNLKPPFLSAEELVRRGYPCDPGFE